MSNSRETCTQKSCSPAKALRAHEVEAEKTTPNRVPSNFAPREFHERGEVVALGAAAAPFLVSVVEQRSPLRGGTEEKPTRRHAHTKGGVWCGGSKLLTTAVVSGGAREYVTRFVFCDETTSPRANFDRLQLVRCYELTLPVVWRDVPSPPARMRARVCTDTRVYARICVHVCTCARVVFVGTSPL